MDAKVVPARPVVGIEIADSATRLTAILAGHASRRHVRLAAPPSPAEAVAHIEALITRLCDDAGVERPAAVGVAVWGGVDASGNITEMPLSAAWATFPLAADLAQRLGAPARVVPAVEAAALAEWEASGAAGPSLLYCHAGRTVASSLVHQGVAVVGASGRAGQLGHLRVSASGVRCSCGEIGHLDTVGSAQSIIRTFIGRASASDESHAAMHRASGGRPEATTVGHIAALAAEGEPTAAGVIESAAEGWAEALATAQLLLDVSRVAIGGPLVGAGDAFLVRVGDRLRAELPRTAGSPRLAYAARPLDGALFGACLVAASAGSR